MAGETGGFRRCDKTGIIAGTGNILFLAFAVDAALVHICGGSTLNPPHTHPKISEIPLTIEDIRNVSDFEITPYFYSYSDSLCLLYSMYNLIYAMQAQGVRVGEKYAQNFNAGNFA